MAFRAIRIMKNLSYVTRTRILSTSVNSILQKEKPVFVKKEFKTEDNLCYMVDPDKFGDLGGNVNVVDTLEDEGDIKEEEFVRNAPRKSQQFTIKQYADLMKQYIKVKRIKEAIDILEVRMLKEDRVKPENYTYNILIGACAEVGYTKKAFQLFNEMKRRGLKPTGDTYTCLFHACSNSPWLEDGLSRAKHIRNLMLEKDIEPNLTIYNSMVKAFGRCGDVATAFKIVDEMASKKIKLRVHTFNHLLHACITDKETGLRHALIVWRKMLNAREKPNIYSFNLMLKCVKECNLGSKEDIEELIGIIAQHILISKNSKVIPVKLADKNDCNKTNLLNTTDNKLQRDNVESTTELVENSVQDCSLSIINNNSCREMCNSEIKERRVPNLLSKLPHMEGVLSLKEVKTLQDKFSVVGGQEDFLKEMEHYSVKPDIKTFTQMLAVLDDTIEAEKQLLNTMRSNDVHADIDFYNMLIKKRCLRSDYVGAFNTLPLYHPYLPSSVVKHYGQVWQHDFRSDVRKIIKKESNFLKRRYPHNKKKQLKINIMTYGVLAMACKEKEDAVQLIKEMQENQLKVNIQILGAMMRQATANFNFPYILYAMNLLLDEKLKVSSQLLENLKSFDNICVKRMQEQHCSESFVRNYKNFLNSYNQWLKKVNLEELQEEEHPWKQFREAYPVPVQREPTVIKEPRKFYKRNKKFMRYIPK